jgi:hypothetical protein
MNTCSCFCTSRGKKFQNSSATVSLALPFALRDASTFRPFLVAIRLRNPCLFFLFLNDGWKVLFISIYFLLLLSDNRSQNY